MSKNEEIAGFLRERMVAEMKRFHQFMDNMNGRGYYGGSIFVQFTDGTTDEYLLRPEDWQDIINFAQSLCTKRTKECQDKLKDFYISSTKDIIEKIESEIADLTKEFYGL